MSSSRLGLRAREVLSVKVVTGPTTVVPLLSSRPSFRARGLPWASFFATSQSRPGARGSAAAFGDNIPRPEKQLSPSVQTAQAAQQGRLKEQLHGALSVVLPGTFVLPPLSQFPKPLGQKIRLLYQAFKIRIQERFLSATMRFTSKPTIFKRAALEYKKSSLIPTAKALHRSMLEGLASGDRMMINKACARQLATNLLMSIDSRPRGRRYSWELVKYTNKLFYPSIKSHRMVPIDRERGAPIIRQAVVAISSKQRRGVYDAEGRVIPGSEKEMDVVEHVAMATMVFPKEGYMQQDWRLIGIIQPSTLESWDRTQKIMEEVVRST